MMTVAIQIAAFIAGGVVGLLAGFTVLMLAARYFKVDQRFDTIGRILLVFAVALGVLLPVMINHYSPPRWFVLAPPGAGFAVELPDGALVPSEPSMSVVASESPFGRPESRTFEFAALGRPGKYAVSYVDLSADELAMRTPERYFEETLRLMVRGDADRRVAILESRSRPLGGHASLEVRYETPYEVVTCRLALVGRRLIGLMGSHSRDLPETSRLVADAKRFIGSLRLAPEGRE